jgi:DNA-binding transcriptional MerR regulator
VLCIFTSDQATCDEILVIDLTRKPDDGTRTTARPPRQIGAVLPADDVCAAISHWRNTQTINAEVLPGRQRSIGAEAAAIHDLKDWDLVDLEPHLIHTGEVRASGPGKPLEDGYSAKRAAEIAGIAYRQLDYWARTDLVRPSLARATGSGSRRRYSYRDLLELRAVKSLLDAGIRLELVREVFTYLTQHLDEDVTRVNLVISGSSVMVRTDATDLVDLIRNGRGVLNILPMVGVKEDLDAKILELHPGDAPDQAILEGHGP